MIILNFLSNFLGKLQHFLGFFLDNELKGVLTLGWGTQPRQTINKLFPGLVSKDYYEIGKMCMDEEMPRNSESQMISATIRWMKQNTDCLFLYTMADGIMGKCGYVYQASNFYFGEKYWTQVYLMENGEKLHPRSTKELCKENAEFLGKEKVFWMTSDFMKHKPSIFFKSLSEKFDFKTVSKNCFKVNSASPFRT